MAHVTNVSTPIRWAGSKRGVIPQIMTVMPPRYSRYIEPFAGSACLFFAAQPETAILADFNPHLIRMFKAIQTNVGGVFKELSRLDPDGNDYYNLRKSHANGSDDCAAAAAFLYLNRFGFNGVYRTNKKGKYNVPRGSKTGRLPDYYHLSAVSDPLASAKLIAQDFRETISDAGPGDLLYVDPPYTSVNRKNYGEYGYGSFGQADDLKDLSRLLSEAHRREVHVIVSFGSVEGLRGLLNEDWRLIPLLTKRKIAAKVSSRTLHSTEILATNYTNQPCDE